MGKVVHTTRYDFYEIDVERYKIQTPAYYDVKKEEQPNPDLNKR